MKRYLFKMVDGMTKGDTFIVGFWVGVLFGVSVFIIAPLI